MQVSCAKRDSEGRPAGTRANGCFRPNASVLEVGRNTELLSLFEARAASPPASGRHSLHARKGID
jgi:hypothetical protein